MLFHSAAQVYGAGTLAVVMTGMGADGLAGARSVHEAGGMVLAQDEASSVVWGMPGRVTQTGIAMRYAAADVAGRGIGAEGVEGRSRRRAATGDNGTRLRMDDGMGRRGGGNGLY